VKKTSKVYVTLHNLDAIKSVPFAAPFRGLIAYPVQLKTTRAVLWLHEAQTILSFLTQYHQVSSPLSAHLPHGPPAPTVRGLPRLSPGFILLLSSDCAIFPIGRLRPSTDDRSWRRLKRPTRCPHYSKSIPSGTFDTFRRFGHRSLTGRSLQDALRTFFQPIKTGDPRVDFYTMYKREATEYDTDYIKKYDEDLNTTLIFVRRPSPAPVNYLTCSCRQVCSLPSVPLSSSMSIRTSNPIPTSNPLPSSARSSSLSISPSSPARLLPSHLFRKIHRARSSPSPVSCMQVF